MWFSDKNTKMLQVFVVCGIDRFEIEGVGNLGDKDWRWLGSTRAEKGKFLEGA